MTVHEHTQTEREKLDITFQYTQRRMTKLASIIDAHAKLILLSNMPLQTLPAKHPETRFGEYI